MEIVMPKKLILAFAATLALAGPAVAEGNDRQNGVGWLLNPGPMAPAARAPVRTARLFARDDDEQARPPIARAPRGPKNFR
jgi:hypothetical protein